MGEHIVERLRNDGGHPDLAHPLCIEAADTIEHLDAIIAHFMADIKQLRAERDAERALADQLFNALHAYYRLGSLMMDPLLRRVFNDYKEARHG